MTKEEHQTRAMLLDMGYSQSFRYYFSFDSNRRLDADTLEEITPEEAAYRQGINSGFKPK